jgi:ubiquinone/menaquinone biosynthesis C-methylase UbiE
MAWIFLRGREPALREKMVDLAGLNPGETVLDVGCGTGTLLIAAKRRVGASGRAFGIDPSPEMIVTAQKKAKRLGADIAFEVGIIESLPFPDAYCDAVLSTLMIHHLPAELRQRGAREIARVLKPGGRVLAVDFSQGGDGKHGLFAYLRHKHGHLRPGEMRDMFGQAGLNITESGAVGMANLYYVLAVA